MNDIRFSKGNGGMGRTADSEDPISGLVMYLPELAEADLINANNALQFDKVENADGTNALYIFKLRYVEELSDLGIQSQALSMVAADYTTLSEVSEFKKVAAVNALVYQVNEFFRQNAEGTLYLGVKVAASSQVNGGDLRAIQNYAGGSIRQCGVFTPALTYVSDSITIDILSEYQTACSGLETEHKPMSVVVTVTGKTVTVSNSGTAMTVTPADVSGFTFATLTNGTNKIASGRCNVSMLVGLDLDSELVQSLGHYAYYGCIGLCMGTISKASVHESIAWVGKFPLGLTSPGLITGELIKDTTTANQEKINDNRYLFVRTHVGNADNYFNDSFTLDEATSDYAYIENVRVIDKACRGVRANLLPYLNSPLLVDATSGKLASDTVSFLETTANKALEEMEKVGELSGFKVEIDPEQNVLSTSEVEIVIKQVPVGVMRHVLIKIGFTTKL